MRKQGESRNSGVIPFIGALYPVPSSKIIICLLNPRHLEAFLRVSLGAPASETPSQIQNQGSLKVYVIKMLTVLCLVCNRHTPDLSDVTFCP